MLTAKIDRALWNRPPNGRFYKGRSLLAVITTWHDLVLTWVWLAFQAIFLIALIVCPSWMTLHWQCSHDKFWASVYLTFCTLIERLISIFIKIHHVSTASKGTWTKHQGNQKSGLQSKANASQTQVNRSQAKPKSSQAKTKPIWLVKCSFYQSEFIYSRLNKILKLHYVIKNATPSQVLLPHWFCFPKKSSDGIRLHYQLLHYFAFHWILLETYHHSSIVI